MLGRVGREGRSASAVLVAPAVLVGLTWAVRGTPLFRGLTGEDAVYEWLQVAALAAATVAAVVAAQRSSGRRRVVTAVLAFGCAVAAGEEMAWGGRLFDVTGTALQDGNVQGETTLHNLEGGLELSFVATLGAAAVGLGRVAGVPRVLASWFAVAAVAAASRLVLSDPSFEAAKLTEATELLLYAAVAWLAVAQAASAAAFSLARSSESTVRSPRSRPWPARAVFQASKSSPLR